jgi:hypothetical protein
MFLPLQTARKEGVGRTDLSDSHETNPSPLDELATTGLLLGGGGRGALLEHITHT